MSSLAPGEQAIHDQALTDLQAAKDRLAIAEQRLRTLETENAILAKRAALAVTQEADTLAPVFAAQAESNVCYRCDHPANKPDPGCECCQNDHTPDVDGNFPDAA